MATGHGPYPRSLSIPLLNLHHTLKHPSNLRLLKDQHAKRYGNRRGMLLQSEQMADLKKIPVDPPKYDPKGHTFGGSSGTGGDHTFEAGSVAGTAWLAAQQEEEEADRLALGLGSEPKKLAKQKKRSRQEMLKEEVLKLQSDWAALLDSLRGFPDTPKLNDIARLERTAKTKKRELQEGHEHDSASTVQKLLEELEALRATLKVAQSFTTGTLQTRRKCGAEFYAKVLVLKTKFPAIFQVYCQPVRNAFNDLHVTKLLEGRDWHAAGAALNSHMDDLDQRDIMERLISIFFKQAESLEDGQLKVLGAELMDALLTMSRFAKDDVQSEVIAIAAVVGGKPLEGHDTLDEPLATRLTQR